MSFVPTRILQRIFPPIVTGQLAASSFLYISNQLSRHRHSYDRRISRRFIWDPELGRRLQRLPKLSNEWYLRALSHHSCTTPSSVCIFSPCRIWHWGLTSVSYSWGSPEFIGLGFLSFVSIILTEMFGSPFLKNISIIVGLAVGCIVAGGAGYIDSTSIRSAPAITFLWCVGFIHLGA